MTPYAHQTEIANEAYEILSQHGLVYLAMEERTGKTLTSIILAERTTRTKVLVLTKKKALDGWKETLNSYGRGGKASSRGGLQPFTLQDSKTTVYVTNYHQASKLQADYDLIILDEAHSYMSAYPKRGTMWKAVKKLTKELPLIYLSATPYAQGYQLLFNQFALSDYGPWRRYANFYRWFDVYGIPSKVRTAYGLQETYKKCKSSSWSDCKHLFITYTRKELDFAYEPEDVIHYVELDEATKERYNNCMKQEMFITDMFESPLDSSMKLRTTLHMIEGGVAKVDDTYYQLNNTEKIDAIRRDFGDTSSTVIMYHYKAEGDKLRKYFEHARLLQGTSYAEGVDLSNYDNLIIYSQDFSTARHSQRRARQANRERDTAIRVHFYIVKGAISEQVYKTVSVNKSNYIDSMFDRTIL